MKLKRVSHAEPLNRKKRMKRGVAREIFRLGLLALSAILTFSLLGCAGGDSPDLDIAIEPDATEAGAVDVNPTVEMSPADVTPAAETSLVDVTPAAETSPVDVNPAVETSTVDIDHTIVQGMGLPEGELTIATPFFGFVIQTFADRYMLANSGVTITVIDYWDYVANDVDLDSAIQETSAQLMAGSGPVLINYRLVDYLEPKSRQYLNDWFPVMYADPNFKEEDWFMNVFHAFAVDGRLYVFPTAYDAMFVLANSKIPGLPEAMAAHKGGITVPGLIELHRSFPTDRQYYLDINFSTDWVRRYFLKDFVDLDTGRIRFDEEFIEVIAHAREITDPDGPQGWSANSDNFDQQMALWGEKYFSLLVPTNAPFLFLDYEEGPVFTGMAHLVNSQGELLIQVITGYLLNANSTPAQQALAWDFIRFMLDPDTRQPQDAGVGQSANRQIMRIDIENLLPDAIKDYKWRYAGTEEEAIEQVISKLSEFGDMPMHNSRALPNRITDAVSEALRLYQDGLVSAEQTASNLQNQVELMFMEMGLR